jgi:GcrA cell cycle regulator
MANQWTDEHVEFLKERWAAGDSASVIGKELGLSRNAVIGKADRLNLPKHHTIKTIQAGHGFKIERKARPATTRKAPVNHKAVAALAEIIDRPPPPKIETLVKPVSLDVKLLDLKDHDCRWPTGERSTISFCGHNTHENKPYCAYHCRMAYNPRAVEPRTYADRLKRAA